MLAISSLIFVTEVVNLYSAKDCPSNLDPYDSTWKYTSSNGYCESTMNGNTCFSEACPNANSFSGELYLIDSKREDRMQIGRGI